MLVTHSDQDLELIYTGLFFFCQYAERVILEDRVAESFSIEDICKT